MTDRAVLLMSYGTPKDLDDVERYYTDIRRGNAPPPELLAELVERYEAIGGRSPLLEITMRQAEGLSDRLGIPVHVGQKHSPPFIPDAFRAISEEGCERVVGLVLAPHFSSMSVGDYERRSRAAAEELDWRGTLTMVESWHLEPGYVKLLAQLVEDAAAALERPSEATVLFTAHSLPTSILESGDPYPEQLKETGAAVAEELQHTGWSIAWQSAGRTQQPWLGPDLLEVIDELADRGAKEVVVCP
ncbi:MAG TPA: ferrochelatase, partial [Actinomycetota bacterium]|nr:ferrochelatase [Actinomycetota bacterium]